MTILYNIKNQKITRKNLRNNMTRAEILLWSKLKNSAIEYKFRRQQGVGKYIVDFYCPRVKLVIELEGEVHGIDKQVKKDFVREKFLENMGLKVKKYTNEEVLKNLNDVLEDLYQTCKDLSLK